MTIYNFPNHHKGDTFRSRQINLGFNITGAEIKMQFKPQGTLATTFFWSTVDNSIIINNAVTGIITMNSKILDEKPAGYVYDFQIKDSAGNVTTYFKGAMLIEQDITV